MRAVREVCDRQGTLVATVRAVALPVDLARTFLGLGDAQPAQLWHPVLAPLVLGAASARGEADTLKLRRGAEAWLKTKPLVDAGGRAYDRVVTSTRTARAGARPIMMCTLPRSKPRARLYHPIGGDVLAPPSFADNACSASTFRVLLLEELCCFSSALLTLFRWICRNFDWWSIAACFW